MGLLNGDASTVAASMRRRKATCLSLLASERVDVDKCVEYLLNKKNYLDYNSALAAGWPIATGVGVTFAAPSNTRRGRGPEPVDR